VTLPWAHADRPTRPSPSQPPHPGLARGCAARERLRRSRAGRASGPAVPTAPHRPLLRTPRQPQTGAAETATGERGSGAQVTQKGRPGVYWICGEISRKLTRTAYVTRFLPAPTGGTHRSPSVAALGLQLFVTASSVAALACEGGEVRGAQAGTPPGHTGRATPDRCIQASSRDAPHGHARRSET